jgi:hypothetical protein
MASISVPASPKEATPRVERGLRLFEEHGSEITFKDGVWLVPSQHVGTSVYEVTLGRRGESCECADFEVRHPEGGCKHIVAATIARAKTAPCAGCGQRFRHRDLYEVHEDHDSLTWFEGDLLCERCALKTGIL